MNDVWVLIRNNIVTPLKFWRTKVKQKLSTPNLVPSVNTLHVCCQIWYFQTSNNQGNLSPVYLLHNNYIRNFIGLKRIDRRWKFEYEGMISNRNGIWKYKCKIKYYFNVFQASMMAESKNVTLYYEDYALRSYITITTYKTKGQRNLYCSKCLYFM